MWTGDSLTVLLFLFGAVIAFSIGGVTAPSGWRANLLWSGAAVSLFAALGWLLAPAASPTIAAIRPFVVAAVQSNALAMVLIVGAVALMQGNRRAQKPLELSELRKQPEEKPPTFAANAGSASKWKPDVSFLDAMLYLFRDSKWGDRANRQPQEIRDKLTEALTKSRITSWGKAHPVDHEFQIISKFWIDTEITLESNCVFSKALNVSAYDVRLCRAELEANWPPKDNPAPDETSPPSQAS